MRRTAVGTESRWSSFVEILRRAVAAFEARRGSADIPHAQPNWWRLTLFVVLGGVLSAFTAATIGFQAAYADRIVSGVTVMGVELGGRSRAEARALLASEAAELGRQTVTIRADGRDWHYTARDLGMNVDPDSLVEVAYGVGRHGSPVQQGASLWGALFMSRQFGAPSPEFDQQRQLAEVRALAAMLDRPYRDARIALATTSDGPHAVITPEQIGIRVQVDESARRLRQAMGAGVPTVVDLAADTEPAKVLAADFRDAKTQADQMLAEPLRLSYQDKQWTVSREEIANLLTFEHTPGQPAAVRVNMAMLNPRLERIGREVDQPAVSARFEWTGSALRVIREGQEGRSVDLEALRTLARERLADDHQVALPVTVNRPSVMSSDAANIEIRGLIREGRTTFAGATAEKAANVRLAALRLNGVVVPSGAMFSFNREVGPTTLDAGFRTGWGITVSSTGAKTVPSVAGGICQVATTLFQPVFHAGYAIEQRYPHAYWINSYGQGPLGMKGLDATVDEEANLDFQFLNTTPDALLIQSRVDGATLYFSLWGVKPAWDVKIEGPVLTNVVALDPEVKREDEPSMPRGRTLQVEAAQDGFTAVVNRTVTMPGEAPRTLRLTSHYQPARNLILVGTGPG